MNSYKEQPDSASTVKATPKLFSKKTFKEKEEWKSLLPENALIDYQIISHHLD